MHHDFHCQISNRAVPNLACCFMYSPHWLVITDLLSCMFPHAAGTQTGSISLPENLLKMKITEFYHRHSESTTQVWARTLCFNKISSWFWCSLKFKNHIAIEHKFFEGSAHGLFKLIFLVSSAWPKVRIPNMFMKEWRGSKDLLLNLFSFCMTPSGHLGRWDYELSGSI